MDKLQAQSEGTDEAAHEAMAERKFDISKTPTESMPEPDTESPSEEEVLQVRSENRARVIEHYNDLSEKYDDAEKQLHSAKYKEDVSLDRMPDELKELDDAEDWEEPEARLDEADRDDEDDEED